MERPFQQITVERFGETFGIRLRGVDVDEKGLEELSAEMARLIDEEGGRRLILNLGPQEPVCLYSVFLARLIHLQRRLQAAGGELVLAQLSKETKKIFQVAGLEKFFRFFPDQAAALEAFEKERGGVH